MAISLSSAAMDFSVLRGPWPGDRQPGLRRGSQERKIGAGGARLVYFIIGESCATREYDDGGRHGTCAAWRRSIAAVWNGWPSYPIRCALATAASMHQTSDGAPAGHRDGSVVCRACSVARR